MATPDSLIRTVRRQLRWTLTLRAALELITLWLFVWGVVVVAVRAVGVADWEWLAWGGLGVLAASVVAVLRARSRTPDERAIRALCDREQACGGLVMSEGEVDVSAWMTRRRVAPLRIEWRSRRQWTLLAAGLAFVTLAFALPDPPAATQQDRDPGTVQFADNVESLEEQLNLLAEEDALEPDQSEELRETLQELTEVARDDAMRAWEMLDHLEKQLAQAAEEMAEQAVAQTASVAEIGALAEALAEDQLSDVPRLDNLAASEALDQLSDMLEGLDPERAAALAEALAEAGIDPEDLRELAQGLRQADSSERLDGEACDLLTQLAGLCEGAGEGGMDQIMKMVDSRLVDPDWIAQCEAAGECDGAALLMAVASGQPGKRAGTGSAPLTFADEPIASEDASYEPTALELAAVDREQAVLLGLSSAAPEEDLPEQRSDVSALQGAATGGGSASSQVILPRHRGAVERYFERE